MMKTKTRIKGFTLLELLLVLAIASSLLIMMLGYVTQKADETRRDRTSMQIQQVLNAAAAYYVKNSAWPANIAALQTSNYLPAGAALVNAWGSAITGVPVNAQGNFKVSTQVGTATDASIIAGRLPFGYVSGLALRVVNAEITIPGENLNNARSANYAAIYRSGACVPAPVCPPGMVAQILVSPSGVSGINDQPTCPSGTGGQGQDPTGCVANAYPVSSFTAFARGDASGNPSLSPLDCAVKSTPLPFTCGSSYAPFSLDEPAGVSYWRVCLSITTQAGLVVPQSNAHGNLMGSILAITRCVPRTGEKPSGTPFNVYNPNQSWNP